MIVSIPKDSSPAKSLWSGIGSFVSSIKDKTLNIVDNIQDQITSFDNNLDKFPIDNLESLSQTAGLELDPNLMPILENAVTYLIEPKEEEYRKFKGAHERIM